MNKLYTLIIMAMLTSALSTKAQDYYFYGYTDTLWSNPPNWDSYNGYPGTTIPAGEYARIPSNFSLGRCSLDVDIVNNGRLLLQSKFYYNGHTVTNNDLIEFTGTVWGNLTNEASGTLSLGWEPFFPTRQTSINGSIDNDGLIAIDFSGTDNSWDVFNSVTTATLGGEVEFRFKNSFEPVLNQEYIFLNATTVVGTFTTETFPAGYDGTVIYTSNQIKVEFTVSPLPVELTSFEAIELDRTALLKWSTASEKNNAGFEIQKSNNGRDWEKVDFIEGNGTTTSMNDYKYVDEKPFFGLNYYRLKQMDFNDDFEYSEVVALVFSGIKNLVTVFPNPSIGDVNIQVDNPSSQIMEVTIYDELGARVWESGLMEGKTNWTKEINLERNGTYYLTVFMGKVSYFERIIIFDK